MKNGILASLNERVDLLMEGVYARVAQQLQAQAKPTKRKRKEAS
jgi:hypothetical protein